MKRTCGFTLREAVPNLVVWLRPTSKRTNRQLCYYSHKSRHRHPKGPPRSITFVRGAEVLGHLIGLLRLERKILASRLNHMTPWVIGNKMSTMCDERKTPKDTS